MILWKYRFLNSMVDTLAEIFSRLNVRGTNEAQVEKRVVARTILQLLLICL